MTPREPREVEIEPARTMPVVRNWMGLDLWQALGETPAQYPDWSADLWAEMLATVRRLRFPVPPDPGTAATGWPHRNGGLRQIGCRGVGEWCEGCHQPWGDKGCPSQQYLDGIVAAVRALPSWDSTGLIDRAAVLALITGNDR